MTVSIIIPAYNEASTIGNCLTALIDGHEERPDARDVEIVVAANACTDDTVGRTLDFAEAVRAVGMTLRVVETPVAGKGYAVNLADRSCSSDIRIYLDADVMCRRGMIAALVNVLDVDEPRYASGSVNPVGNGNFFSEHYGFVWKNLPFVKADVAGCGLYAVNAAGRKRWNEFPQIHSDDKFVRLQFSPKERFKVDVEYDWPLPNSFRGLFAVRSRWCRGNLELESKYGHLVENDLTRKIKPGWAMGFALRNPLSSLVFTSVYSAAKVRALFENNAVTAHWERTR